VNLWILITELHVSTRGHVPRFFGSLARCQDRRSVPFAPPSPPRSFLSIGAGAFFFFSFQDLPRVKTLSSGVLPRGVSMHRILSLPLPRVSALPPNWPKECMTKPSFPSVLTGVRSYASLAPVTRRSRRRTPGALPAR